jgi:chromosome partitioning protein
MPVIAIASPKGGAGKSTTALVLGTTLAFKGATVSLIDTDPQGTVRKWAEGAQSKYSQYVQSVTDPNDVLSAIDNASEQNQFTLVDVQGRATLTIARVFSRADLVIIPMKASTPDAEEAAEAIQLIRNEEKALRRPIKYAMLFTMTNPGIVKKEEREIINRIEKAGLTRFSSQLNERSAFSRMHSFKTSLYEMDPKTVHDLNKAISNAETLAGEVINMLVEG